MPEAMEEELRQALEAGGHRFTAQRAAVYEVLGASKAHPTADEIFTSVREKMPDISLATVYKALEAFVGSGVAQKLTIGEGPARYDGRTDAHDHLRCLECGSIVDVECMRHSSWLEVLTTRTDYEVLDYRLELLGYCDHCRH